MELKTILRYTLLAGLFALPFVPFIVSTSMFFPFITGKNFTFRIVVEIMFAAWVLLALRDPEWRPRFSWMSVAVAFLFGAAALSTFFSVDPVKSFWSNFERMEGMIGFIHIVLLYIVAHTVFVKENLFERFLQVSVGASVIMGCYVLFQIADIITINQGGVRVDGTFGNAIYLGVYMLFHVFFALFLALRHRGHVAWYAVYGAIVVLQIVALYYTGTRSAMFGLIGGLLISSLSIAWLERNRIWVRRLAIGLVAALVLSVGTVAALRDMPSVKENGVLNRFASVSFSDSTVFARVTIWTMALEGFKEHPVLGWGFENFSYVFNKYYTPSMYAQEQWFDRAHNAYVDWLVAAGILGFLGFISLFCIAALAFLRAETLTRSEKALFIGLLAGYGFHSFFVFDNLMSSVYFFVLLAFAHVVSRKKLPGSFVSMTPISREMFIPAGVAVVLILVGSLYYFNILGIKKAQTLIAALTSTTTTTGPTGNVLPVQKDPKQNLASFSEALLSVPLGRQEATEQLLQATSQVLASQNADPAVKQAFLTAAGNATVELMRKRPGDVRLELFLASVLNQAGLHADAERYLMQALEVSKQKQSIYFELGTNTYLPQGKTEEALSVLKTAFELEPAFDEARTIYAYSLYKAGREAEADALLVERYKTAIVDDNRLLRAYYDAGRMDRVLGVWKMRAEKNPTDGQTLVSLALAYKAAGDSAKGLSLLRAVAAGAPQYRAQLDELAKQEFGQGL